jgi:hypothetical protein
MPKRLLCFPLLFLLFSCSNKGYSLLTILTDQKDMLLISEYYNKIQDNTRLLLIYDDYISLDDLESEKYDLIVGEDLNNSFFRSEFLPLQIPKDIYPVLEGDVNSKGKSTLLPLAFDLPVIVYSQDRTNLPQMMSPKDLQQLGSAENKKKEDQFVHMGFSPLWNPEFIYWYLNGENISFYNEGYFHYEQDKLTSGINEVRQWVEMSNESLTMEKAFNTKYRYIPDYKLLQQGIIDYVPMTFSEYSLLPGEETSRMTYSWFGDGEHINPVNCLYAGIPKVSAYPDRAEEFIDWLLSDQGQKKLIQYKGVASPGFALFDRFSSLEEINRLHLPLVFSDKLGHKIFLSEQLGAPPMEPENWSAVKKEVIHQWLNKTLWENNALPLSSFYKEWQLLFID